MSQHLAPGVEPSSVGDVQAAVDSASIPAGRAHAVVYARDRMTARADALARTRNARMVSLLVSVAISVGLWWFTRDQGGISVPLLAIVLIVPVVLLIVATVRAARARSVARHTPEGVAFTILPQGLWLPEGLLEWTQVEGVRVRRRRGLDELVVDAAGRPQAWRLDALAGTPAGLANAVWALSGGRHSVDFSALKP